MKPYNRILALLIIVSIICLFGVIAKAQTFSNAPLQYQTLLGLVDSIPTVPLNQATVFIGTGAYNGPSVDTKTGTVNTVLENYVDADFRVGTNFTVGGGFRNVMNKVTYGGLSAAYTKQISTNMLIGPRLEAGYDIDHRAPQVALSLEARYHPFGGSPYLYVSGGYAETFGTGFGTSHSGGSGMGKAGLDLPF